MKRKLTCFLALVLCGLVALAFAELAIRFIFSGSEISARIFAPGNEKLPYILVANVNQKVWQYGRSVDIATDSQHDRVTENSKANQKKIHLIGDSQVFGWGLSDRETIASKLQEKVGRDWCVVNHGVPGYGPNDYLECVKNIAKSEPIIVLFSEENDYADLLSPGDRYTAKNGFLLNSSKARFLPDWLLNLKIFHLTAVLAARSEELAPMQFDPNRKCCTAVISERLRSIVEEMQSRSEVPLIVGWVPWDVSILPDRKLNYRPVLSESEPSFPIRDDLHLRSLFRNSADPAGLFLVNDPHLSPAAASLVATHLYRCFWRTFGAKNVDPSPP